MTNSLPRRTRDGYEVPNYETTIYGEEIFNFPTLSSTPDNHVTRQVSTPIINRPPINQLQTGTRLDDDHDGSTSSREQERKPEFNLVDLQVNSSDLIYDAPPAYSVLETTQQPFPMSSIGNGENSPLLGIADAHLPVIFTETLTDHDLTNNNNSNNIRSISSLGAEPVQIRCPTCGFVGRSEIDHVVGSCTWIMCCFMFMVSGFCCLPFFMDGVKDVVHKCPRCQHHLGRFERFPMRDH